MEDRAVAMNKQSVLMRAKKRHAYACVQSQRWQEAVHFYEEICQYNREDAECWFMLGTVHGRLGHIEAAETAMRKTIWLQPDFLQAYLNLGHILESQGRLDEAARCYAHALTLKPEAAEIHEALARLLERHGDLEQAIAQYEEAIRIYPERASAHFLLGKALQGAGRNEKAIASYARTLRLDPHAWEVHYQMARAYFDLNHYKDSTEAARLALQARPDHAEAAALEVKASRLSLADDTHDETKQRAGVEPALQPTEMAASITAPAVTVALAEGDHDDVRRLEALLEEEHLSRAQRRAAHFYLAARYETAGNYQQAFAHYQAAHASTPASFDVRAYTDKVDKIIACYNRAALARAPRAGNCSERPVFIVGLPCSGVVLMEQMLAAHAQVGVVAQSGLIGDLAGQLAAELGGYDPAYALTELNRIRLDELAERHLAELLKIVPTAKRVIDKTAQNFLHLGVVELLFPTARVIHCVRDPLDVCVCCYCQELGDGHPYAHDLAQLGHYYRQYRRLMDHWYQVLDVSILEVNYEEMIQNPHKIGRNVAAFCDLKWAPDLQDHLLSMHMHDYHPARAAGYWKHYEPYVGPLKRVLEGGA